jgi:MFS family permease
MTEPSLSSLLRQRPRFRRLFLARLTSHIGNGMAPIALAFAVLDLTGSTSRLGIALASRTIPMLFLLLVGGALADRLPRHRLLVASDLVSGIAHVALGLLVLSNHANFVVLLVLVAVTGLASGVLLPAMTGIVPSLVESEELPAANALLRLSVNVGQIGGASIGGLLAAWSPSSALIVDALTFFVSAVFVARLGTLAAVVTGESLLVSLRSGWRAFVSRRWIVIIVVAAAFNNGAISSTFGVLGPTMADASFGRRWWGVIMASFTVGLLIGGFVGAKVKANRPMLVASLAIAGSPTVLIMLALDAPPILLCLGFAAVGLGFEFFTVLWDTALQRHVPHDLLSRVSAYDWMLSLGVTPVFLLVVGPLAASIGVGRTLWIMVAVGVTGFLMPLFSTEIRKLAN